MLETLGNRLIVATTEHIAGYRSVMTLGQCFGVVVRSRGLGGNIIAGLRTIVGGEIHEYTQLLEEARRHALDRLVQNATAMGANAVLMMRYDSAEIWQYDERDRRLRHGGGDRTPTVIPFLFPLGFFLAVFLVWFFFRSGGYKRQPLDAPPGRDWTFTGERFLDPQLGAMLEVWYCPRTGERAYVPARAQKETRVCPIKRQRDVGPKPLYQARFATLALFGVAAAGPFEAGEAAYKRSNYAAAIGYWRPEP